MQSMCVRLHVCVAGLLYVRHIFIFVSDKFIFFYWRPVSVHVFLNQIKAAVAANRRAPRRRVCYEYKMTLKYMLCRPGKHPILCVHLTLLLTLPRETFLSW